MQQITESDWKIARDLKIVALERLCQRIVEGIRAESNLNSSSYYDRFNSLWLTIQKGNNDVARIFDGFRRSNAIEKIALMKLQGLIDDAEYSRLSTQTKASADVIVRAFAERGKNPR